jgi:hypothetical protein
MRFVILYVLTEKEIDHDVKSKTISVQSLVRPVLMMSKQGAHSSITSHTCHDEPSNDEPKSLPLGAITIPS